ncbi:MAG: hypothetical protein R3C68_07185 [Myxococcota bacterium]
MTAARITFLMTSLFALCLSGCSGSGEAKGCKPGGNSCNPGHVCISGRCEKLCDTNNDCPLGTYCGSESRCLLGQPQGDIPQITRVIGNSSQLCSDSTLGPLGNCLGTAFIVEGEQLADATFTLINSDAQGPNFPLELTEAALDNRVSLRPTNPTALQAGLYTLRAVNGVGTGSQSVQLLKGDTGPKGDPGTGSGGAATLFFFDNSPSATQITSTAERAYIRVIASTPGNAIQPLAIDDTVFTRLCGDQDGCTIAIGATPWGGTSAGSSPTTLWGPECRFFLNPTDRSWSVSQGCLCPDPGNPLCFNRYDADKFNGIDGTDDNPGTESILSLKGGCFFSESPPGAPGLFQTDSAAGFYFFANNSDWDSSVFPSGVWNASDPARTCEMAIRN